MIYILIILFLFILFALTIVFIALPRADKQKDGKDYQLRTILKKEEK